MESSKQVFVVMATPILILLCFFHHIPSTSAVAPGPNNSGAADFIRSSCNGTLYPNLCYNTLSPFAKSIQNDKALLAETAISVSLKKSKTAAAFVARQQAAAKTTGPLEDCVEVLKDAADEARKALIQMKEIVIGAPVVETVKFKASNVQTWMSAVLSNQVTCIDGLEGGVEDGPVKTEVVGRATVAKKVTSNALALINKYVNA